MPLLAFFAAKQIRPLANLTVDLWVAAENSTLHRILITPIPLVFFLYHTNVITNTNVSNVNVRRFETAGLIIEPLAVGFEFQLS